MEFPERVMEWLKANRPGYFPILERAKQEVERLLPIYEAARQAYEEVRKEIQPEVDTLDAELKDLAKSKNISGEQCEKWRHLDHLASSMTYEQREYQRVIGTREKVPSTEEIHRTLDPELCAIMDRSMQTLPRETELRECLKQLETEHRDAHARVYRREEETRRLLNFARMKVDEIEYAMQESARLVDAYTNPTEYLNNPHTQLIRG
jgi:hypothetical protein